MLIGNAPHGTIRHRRVISRANPTPKAMPAESPYERPPFKYRRVNVERTSSNIAHVSRYINDNNFRSETTCITISTWTIISGRNQEHPFELLYVSVTVVKLLSRFDYRQRLNFIEIRYRLKQTLDLIGKKLSRLRLSTRISFLSGNAAGLHMLSVFR